MAIVIHGIPGSPYVRMPILACEEKGVAWRLEAMGFGDQNSPEHLARQPFGRIPAIEHGDFKLYECQAILRYIDAAFEGPRLTPQEPKAMARMSQVLNILDWYVMPSLTGAIGFNRIVKPMLGRPVDEAAIAQAVPLARTSLQALEAILGSNRYFAGDELSLADVAAVAHLEMVPASPEGAELIAGSPLLGWLGRMGERESVRNSTMQKMMGAPAPA